MCTDTYECAHTTNKITHSTANCVTQTIECVIWWHALCFWIWVFFGTGFGFFHPHLCGEHGNVCLVFTQVPSGLLNSMDSISTDNTPQEK